ncbi:MAG TPA: alpha/beta hydrolase [Gemmatimonadetes bacterium]|nr:alpha/beta hydrolase [Gemmatimonadota bacterium]
MWKRLVAVGAVSALLLVAPASAQAPNQPDVFDRVEHHYADSDGTSIHYVTLGDGPLVVMIHGFPDFWYTWRDQMTALAAHGYRVAAMDTRGYNRSDQPERVEDYAMPLLVGDVAAVIADQGLGEAIVVGHDWGGMIAWNVAMSRPDVVERLIVLNLPHPKGLTRELANNPDQERNSQYARNFQAEGSHERLSPAGLALWVRDAAARAHYVEAFERSSLFGMMAYYKANYPRPPYQELPDDEVVRIGAPVLQIHGLEDQYLLHAALDGTWRWLDADYTLVTLPGINHFVQFEASEAVTEAILMWLKR